MRDALARFNPFTTPDARRFAMLFGIVYFAQGMWYLPNQTITIVLKERGLSAAEVATFFTITTLPWLIKPVYGLISDFVPILGSRRRSYFLLTSAVATVAGLALALIGEHAYRPLVLLFTVMGLGLAFTDVLTDALMVEAGRERGLTGAFQSVQWAGIYTASIAVGIIGGQFAEARNLHGVFAVAACFPLVSFVMALRFVHEPPVPPAREAFRETLLAIRAALGERDVWVVAGFILFWTFSPSFGPSLLYYQTDVLGFSQTFIGVLTSLGAGAAVLGAFAYAPLSRRVRLQRLIVASIVVGTAGTLGYLLYRSAAAAVIIDVTYGFAGIIVQLAFLDLAAKACPRHVEATFFALLMSVYNLGMQGSQIVGGWLYDWLGFEPLVLISAALTLLALPLVPLVRISRIDARARGTAPAQSVTAE